MHASHFIILLSPKISLINRQTRKGSFILLTKFHYLNAVCRYQNTNNCRINNHIICNQWITESAFVSMNVQRRYEIQRIRLMALIECMAPIQLTNSIICECRTIVFSNNEICLLDVFCSQVIIFYLLMI